MPPPTSLPAHFQAAFKRLGDVRLLIDQDVEVSLGTLLERAAAVARGLLAAGVKAGDRVGFYADNSHRWIITDVGIQLAGAVSVPRGTDTPADELAHLFDHAAVSFAFAHAARHAQALEALRSQLPQLGEIITLDPTDAPGRTLDDLEAAGTEGPSLDEMVQRIGPQDLATIIYTSGTTGRPKGVMLTQGNFSHQVSACPGVFHIGPSERFLSVLPPWHIFERTVEYIALCSGAELVYTDRRRFKDDLAKYSPTFVPSVPRLWETVYAGVQRKVREGPAMRRAIFRGALASAKLRMRSLDRMRGHAFRVHRPKGLGTLTDGFGRAGAALVAGLTWPLHKLGNVLVFSKIKKVTGGRLRGAISGGGLMPQHIDRFFQAIGVPILVGYGLTETSPVVCVRREERNVLGTIGTLVPGVEVQVRDPETGRTLGIGEIGVIHTRGAHVMEGYYRDAELTSAAIDEAGWFDTGDLGLLTEEGDVCFRGRIKETIVLKGGENLEPSGVEEAILASPLVEQAIVVGQDQKVPAALILPSVDAVAEALGEDPAKATLEDLRGREEVRRLLHDAVGEATRGLKPYERIHRISLLPEPLDITNNCLTQTLKPRRHIIVDVFAKEIEAAYKP